MSETDFLKLKKHDNVETNTEKFDIENYLNGNWDKINENAKEVNTNISNINSKNTELETELKEAQEDFYQNSIRGQASGEYIHVEDSSNCRARIGINGNSKQETRSGKNKLQLYFSDKTTSGVTITKNEDDSITLIGTATANINFFNLGKFLYELAKGTFKGCLTYKSGSMKDGSAGLYFSSSTTSGTNKGGTTLEAKNKSFALSSTVTEDANIYPYIYINSGTTFDNFTFYFQVVNSDTDDFDYEQYGASPSPDYPSSIQSVGDDVNELNPIAGGSQGINSSVIEGKISFSGTANTTFANITSITVGVIKKGTYIFSINEAKNYSVRLRMYYTESEYIDAIIPENKKEVVIELTNDVIKYYTYIYPLTAGTNYNDFIYEKLQKGTKATPYSPYGMGCVNEKVQNKNFFDLTKKPYSESDSTLNGATVVIENGIMTVSASSTGAAVVRSKWEDYRSSNSIYLPAGSYYTKLRLNISGVGQVSGAFTLNEPGYITQWFVSVSQNTTMRYKLQVEQGSTATDYVKHQSQTFSIPTQQPFRAIGDIRDTFIKKNNKWYERHYIKEVILTGDENWTQRNQGDGTNTITFNINLLNVGAYGSNNVICDKFVYEQNSASGNEGIGFESILVTQYIQINRNRLSSPNLEGFKAWLSNNNIKLYYVLKIPEDIECTEEQSKVLDELNNARTYKNVTNIYSTDEISPIIDLDYAKDLETLLNNTQALAVNNASEGV